MPSRTRPDAPHRRAPLAPAAPPERGLPPEIARGVRGALNLTEAQLPAPVDWHHLRDVMAAVVAERPGARPAGLDDATSGVISARVRVALVAPEPAPAARVCFEQRVL